MPPSEMPTAKAMRAALIAAPRILKVGIRTPLKSPTAKTSLSRLLQQAQAPSC
jgi:hypothetical protein